MDLHSTVIFSEDGIHHPINSLSGHSNWRFISLYDGPLGIVCTV